jgi:nucleoside-diphosphate-sugar epimerase
MKRILVTGAGGYIGNELCQQITQKGWTVFGVDNLRFGQPKPDIHFFAKGDVTDISFMRDILRETHPDAIVHLAALVGMPICKANPEEATMVNVESTRLLLENIGPEVQFIQPCTNSQYGTVAGDVLCDENTPTNPISLYAVTKCISEALVLNRLNSVSLRLATVYGLQEKRMRSDLLVNFFVKTLVEKRELVLFEPEFKRNMIHLNDVAGAFVHAIDKQLEGVYNVGDDALNSTKGELAQKVADIVGGKVIVSTEGEDPDKRNYNVSSAKFYNTGYNIESEFDKNIKELEKYYETWKDAPYV